jgi:hypothetical protein
LKCCAKAILKEVFPMAVGPTMVIKYFIFFSPDSSENPPDFSSGDCNE